MKDSEIVEVLEDGTIYHFDMDVCNDEADKIIESLQNKEDNLIGYDYTATVFSLFVHCIHILNDSGWTIDELLYEVLNHTSKNDTEE